MARPADTQPEASGYDVYLFIGQSNCAGRGPMIASDTTDVQEGVWLLNAEGRPEPARGPMNRYSNIRKDLSMQMVGPAMSFGRLMHHYTSRPILIVQNARGGSALRSWMPGGDGRVAYLDSTLVRARQALRYGRLRGIVWHQGETDIERGTSGADYVTRFAAMAETLRRALGVGDEVPIIVGEVGQWGWAGHGDFEPGDNLGATGRAGRSATRQFNDSTLEAVTRAVGGCYKVSSAGLGRRGKESDPHFSRDGALRLGQRYAEAMLPLVADVYATRYRGDRQAALSLTYDDGYLEHYTLVAPELERRGLRGSFWLIGSMMGDTVNQHGPRMTWEQARELVERGHDVGSHTWSHPHLTLMHDLVAVRAEMERNDTAFAHHGLPRPAAVAYPYNGFTPDVRAIAEAGRVGSRTWQVGHGEQNNKVTPERLTRWLHAIVDQRDWGVTMTHGITHGYDRWYHPEWLWAFYDEVRSMQDVLWVGTFAEVAAYQQEREHLTLDVERGRHEWVVTPTLYGLDREVFHESLTLRLNGDWAGTSVRASQSGRALSVSVQSDCLLVDFDPWAGAIRLRVR